MENSSGFGKCNGENIFLDCGEGNCFEDDNIECENLTGWLIDIDKSNEFEVIFKSFSNIDDVWDDYQLVEKVQHMLGFLLFLWYNRSGDENVGKES